MCSCDNLNGIYCEAHKYKSAEDSFQEFKRSDLAFFIERLQIVLDVISIDHDDQPGIEDAQYHAQSLWDFCRYGNKRDAERTLEWFYGYIWAVPDSHKWSYRHMVAAIRKAITNVGGLS